MARDIMNGGEMEVMLEKEKLIHKDFTLIDELMMTALCFIIAKCYYY